MKRILLIAAGLALLCPFVAIGLFPNLVQQVVAIICFTPKQADALLQEELSMLPQPERGKIADSLRHCKELLEARATEQSFVLREQYLVQAREELRQSKAWSQHAALSPRTHGWLQRQFDDLEQQAEAMQKSDDETLKPSQETAESCVRQYIADYFKDPYSVRDLVIGQPKFYCAALHPEDRVYHQDWWLVPYWCNTKNGFGGYIGKKLYVLGLVKKDNKWWFNTGLGSDYFELLYNDASVPSSSPTPQQST
jgi:hypothetical protein